MEKPVVIVKESKMQAPVTHLLEVSFKIRGIDIEASLKNERREGKWEKKEKK